MPVFHQTQPAPTPTVLLVEDNEVNRYTVARMLRQAGFAVLEARSGAQATEILGGSNVDAIVCDVDLPDVNGFDLCRRLKSEPATASIPFLQMSASFTSAQHQVQGLEGGADGYLVQPFEVPVLAATIRALLRVRAAEERARSLSRQWETTFAAIRDGIVVTDTLGRITRCNQAFAQLFGLAPHDLEGQLVSSLGEAGCHLSPQPVPGSEAEVEVEAPGEVRIGERWLRVRRDWIFDERGRATGLAQTLSDITRRKSSERERDALIHSLQFERERLEAIFMNVPAAVAVLRGPELRVEMLNPAFQEIVGSREVLGLPVTEALPEIRDQEFPRIAAQVLASGQPFEGREMRVLLQREPGEPPEERFIHLLYQPLHEADGGVSGVFSHSIDITELVRARQEAETANRLKDEFLATLSHELRTPLNAVLGWTQMLRTGGLDAASSSQALEIIERNARAQGQLIEDILDVSRIMSGKLVLDARELDLAACIEGAVNAVRPAAGAKGIRLSIELDPQAGLISGDAGRLQQVIWNLLSNAIKFTPRGGRVGVMLDRLDSQAQVTVEDSGQGIDAKFLPHVFDRFRQADSSSTRAHSGLGLGLAIVRHLVELHGGTIHASSAGVGQGSTFQARFPLAVAPANPPEEASEESREFVALSSASSKPVSSAPGELDGLRVLVVDDEADARALVHAILRQAGAAVLLAASAESAWRILEGGERPHVLVSDIGMPEQDGHSLIERLRAGEESGGRAPLPAIALTAFARAEDRASALRAGFDVYLSKPIEPSDLVAAVARLAR